MALNKREKKMLIATCGIVVVAGVTFLVGGDDGPPPADAAPPPAVEKSVSAPAKPPAANTSATPTSGEAPGSTNQAPALVSTLELQLQLDRLRAAPAEIDFEDPFRTIVTPVEADAEFEALSQDLPQVSGVFFSSATDRGAVLDGKLVFLNEACGSFRLHAVDPGGVVLEANGRTYRIVFDPLTGGGYEKGESDD